MECEHMRELVGRYADGQATDAERARFDGHMRECPDCRRRLRWVRALKTSVRASAPRPPMPPELRARLLREAAAWSRPAAPGRAIRSWLESWRSSRRAAWGYGFASAFAAAAAVLAFAYFFAADGSERISLDEVLVAHDRYELTMPAADREAIFADLGMRMSGGGRDAR